MSKPVENFTFDFEIDPSKGRRQWVACLPAGTLAAVPTKNGPRVFRVMPEYLHNAVSELERYYSDLRARGSDYLRPIIANHDKSNPELDEATADGSRRSGDILAAKVAPYNPQGPDYSDGPETLFLLVEWLPNAWEAVLNKELQHTSVTVKPKWQDRQSGEVYSPFIFELSETTTPVVVEFNLGQTLDPSVLEGVGLQLADDGNQPTTGGSDMEPEEVQQIVTDAVAEHMAAFTATIEALQADLAALSARVDEMGGDDGEEEEIEAGNYEEPTVEMGEVLNGITDTLKVLNTKIDKVSKDARDAKILAAKSGKVRTGEGTVSSAPEVNLGDDGSDRKKTASDLIAEAEKNVGPNANTEAFTREYNRLKQAHGLA